MKTKIFLLTLIIIVSNLLAQVSLPAIFGDNMVLQQKSETPIWGNGNPNSEIFINTSWGENVQCKVGTDSLWKVNLKTPKAGGPYEITITDNISKIEYTNVLIGEVWLCSGQSNMEMPLEGWPTLNMILNSESEIANSQNDQIRFFTVRKDIAIFPQKDCIGEWVESSPNTSKTFSATAYFFGKKLNQELGIPIGLIHSSWGGTPAESWTSREYISKIPEFTETINNIDISIPAAKELDAWLRQFKIIDLSKRKGDDIWTNLNFDDEECSSVNFNDNGWKTMQLPALWESTELGDFDGAIWFRKIVEIPSDWLNKDLQIELGPIDDFDITYVNGKLVGKIEEEANWQTPRIYKILKENNNRKQLLISVRVNDISGGGGIYGKPESMKLVLSDGQEEIPLAGQWHYLPIAEYRGMKYFIFGANETKYLSRPKLPIDLNASTPTLLYNAMIAPLVPLNIKGAIWYQGESNAGNPQLYEKIFSNMIINWRNDFQNNFPFYFVQIAPWDYGDKINSAFLRDAQRKTLSIENTGMVVTLDIGDTTNIHPANKKDVGERLALWALAKDYEKDIVYSGPLYKSFTIKENKIEIEFENIGTGLVIKEGKNQFLISDNNKKFVSAKSKIENNKLIIWCNKVTNPVAVRYAWHNNAQATLFNNEGLPASSFRTDDWD